MCIEDNPAIQRMLILALGEIGRFDVCICADGGEALQQVPCVQPDLILLDWTLEGPTASETLASLQHDLSEHAVPVLVMSASCNGGFEQMVLSRGACGTLAKPIDPMRLAAQLRQLFEPEQGQMLN